MKTNFFLLCLLLAISANAQIVYHDASAFPLLGKATETTLTRYERLPDSLRNISRKPLWELGRNSAGLAVRFRSNSTRIAAKWEVLLNRNMNHMTPTGIKGLDLYCLQDGKWLFAGSGRPQGKVNEATIVKDMLQLPIRHTADYLFACSDIAGRLMYGEKATKQPNYWMIPNGVDLNRFAF